MKKIFSIFIALLMLSQTTIFAAPDIDELIEKHMTDLVDMDRVFKYDYMKKDSSNEGSEPGKEILKYHNAVNTVLALGIMNRLDNGTFGEDEAVPFKAFAKIIMQLTTGPSAELEKGYELYPDTQYTTFNEAVYYLIGALGYDLYDGIRKGDNPRLQAANQIGLLDGVKFAAEKNITRGELAQMIFNALQTEMIVQTVYGTQNKYEKIEGQTLLKEKYEASLVYGTVTAQNGLNLYNEGELEQGTICIDHVQYELNGNKIGDVLGYRVQAIVSVEDDEEYKILGIALDEDDDTISIKVDNSTYCGLDYLHYSENGKEKKISISNLETVIINDTEVSIDEFVSKVADIEGEIRICKASGNSRYNLAVVRNWSTFVVRAVSSLDEKIYLKYNAIFNSQNYIDVSDDKQVYIKKDGEDITLDDISVGSVIDVIETSTGDSVIINVSDTKVSGTIAECYDDSVCIDGKDYLVSPSYINARAKESTLPELVVGKTGTFKLNINGKIADYSKTGNVYKLGLLSKFAKEKGIDEVIKLKIYTEDGAWEELALADKLTLDGVKDTKCNDAYNIMQNEKDTITYAPIRFGLDSEGKVKFLDTTIVNEIEKEDSDTIIKAADITESKMNWTVDYADWTGIGGTKYFYSKDTTFMVIPREEDRDREEDYAIGKKSYLQVGMIVDMTLYNVDKFGGAGIILREGSTSNVLPFEKNYSWLVFTGLSYGHDDEGNERVFIKGFDSTATAYAQKTFYLDKQKLIDEAETYHKGDLIHFSADGLRILQMERDKKFEELGTDWTMSTTDGATRTLADVVDVDPDRRIVKVDVNGEETTWYIHSAQLYDSVLNKGYEISYGDILPGDRVFGLGGDNFMRVLVIR